MRLRLLTFQFIPEPKRICLCARISMSRPTDASAVEYLSGQSHAKDFSAKPKGKHSRNPRESSTANCQLAPDVRGTGRRRKRSKLLTDDIWFVDSQRAVSDPKMLGKQRISKHKKQVTILPHQLMYHHTAIQMVFGIYTINQIMQARTSGAISILLGSGVRISSKCFFTALR